MILVVGATGTVGHSVATTLAKTGKRVRALVRSTAQRDKVTALRDAGVEVVIGDLRDRASLEQACAGAKTVITSASTTLSRQPGDSLEATDQAGQESLVDSAKAAGASQFILTSFPQQPVDSPLQRAKRAVEDRLKASGMRYTILRPTYFLEIWFSPPLGFDFSKRKARLFGSGDTPHPFISVTDVAAYIVASVDNPKALDQTFDLGGPEAFSQRDAVRVFEELGKQKFTVEEAPEAGLAAHYESARDSMEKSFAALSLSAARGVTMDATAAEAALPIAHRGTLREYVERSLALT